MVPDYKSNNKSISNHLAAGLAAAGDGRGGRARGRPGAGAQRERHGRALNQTAPRRHRCDDAKAVVLVGGAKVGVYLVISLDAAELEVVSGGGAGHHGIIAASDDALDTSNSRVTFLLGC